MRRRALELRARRLCVSALVFDATLVNVSPVSQLLEELTKTRGLRSDVWIESQNARTPHTTNRDCCAGPGGRGRRNCQELEREERVNRSFGDECRHEICLAQGAIRWGPRAMGAEALIRIFGKHLPRRPWLERGLLSTEIGGAWQGCQVVGISCKREKREIEKEGGNFTLKSSIGAFSALGYLGRRSRKCLLTWGILAIPNLAVAWRSPTASLKLKIPMTLLGAARVRRRVFGERESRRTRPRSKQVIELPSGRDHCKRHSPRAGAGVHVVDNSTEHYD